MPRTSARPIVAGGVANGELSRTNVGVAIIICIVKQTLRPVMIMENSSCLRKTYTQVWVRYVPVQHSAVPIHISFIHRHVCNTCYMRSGPHGGLEPVPKPGVCSPTTCSPLCKGFHCLLWRKSEPPPSTYPPHNGSVRGVVYWPHSDMGVGNDGGTKCSQWDWEHPQVVFLAPLGVSSWCGYRWAQATAAHIGG